MTSSIPSHIKNCKYQDKHYTCRSDSFMPSLNAALCRWRNISYQYIIVWQEIAWYLHDERNGRILNHRTYIDVYGINIQNNSSAVRLQIYFIDAISYWQSRNQYCSLMRNISSALRSTVLNQSNACFHEVASLADNRIGRWHDTIYDTDKAMSCSSRWK